MTGKPGCSEIANYLLELFLGLLLHPPDVLHGQAHPFVDPAEELAVEVCENALFLLRVVDRKRRKKKEKKDFISLNKNAGNL